MLLNSSVPTSGFIVETTLQQLQEAAHAMGLQLQVLYASTSREIDAAFATFGRERPDTVFVPADALFFSRRVQLVTLAVRDRIPTAYAYREIPTLRFVVLHKPLPIVVSLTFAGAKLRCATRGERLVLDCKYPRGTHRREPVCRDSLHRGIPWTSTALGRVSRGIAGPNGDA